MGPMSSQHHPRAPLQRLLYATSLLLAAVLGGCSGSATPTPEPVTIVFSHGEAEEKHYEELLTPFYEKYPNIAVDLRQDQIENADCYVDQVFELPGRVQQGAVVSLDAWLEGDASFNRDDFYPGALEAYRRDGKLWGIPAGVDVLVMYYNQSMFSKAGLPFPQNGWTWDNFLSATLAISKPDDGVFGYAAPQRADAFDALLFVYQHGGRIFDNLAQPTTTTFDDPLTIEAVDWYARLINTHNVAPTPLQIRDLFGGQQYALYRAIFEGKIGTWIGFFSERGGRTWPTPWVIAWGMVPLPRDALAFTGGMIQGYSISAKSQHPEACWQWISYLSRQASPGLVPARKSVAESAAFEGQVGKDAAVVARAAMENAVLISPDVAQYEQALTIFYQALQDVIEGRATAEEAMMKAQQQAAGISA